MNNNRSHDYENYMNSFGMKDIQCEAGMARMFTDAELDMPRVEKAKQKTLRFVAFVIAILLLLFFFFS